MLINEAIPAEAAGPPQKLAARDICGKGGAAWEESLNSVAEKKRLFLLSLLPPPRLPRDGGSIPGSNHA